MALAKKVIAARDFVIVIMNQTCTDAINFQMSQMHNIRTSEKHLKS